MGLLHDRDAQDEALAEVQEEHGDKITRKQFERQLAKSVFGDPDPQTRAIASLRRSRLLHVVSTSSLGTTDLRDAADIALARFEESGWIRRRQRPSSFGDYFDVVV